MKDTVEVVRDFYDSSVQAEWERLQRHPFEYELTCRYLNRYIKPGDKVLDVGGGPGRYSLYLADKGCDVTLFDLSAGIIYAMKHEPQMLIEAAMATPVQLFVDDLPFAGDGFTKAFFIRHKDVLPFMAQFPLQKLHYFGQESILAPCEENIKAQPQAVIDKWLDVAEQVCEREDLLSYSEHLMYVGKNYSCRTGDGSLACK